MDQVGFLLLTSLVLLGKFADFLLTTPLANMSDSPPTDDTEDPNREWGSYLVGSVYIAHRYFVKVFGERFFEKKRLCRVFLLSAFLVQGSFLFSALIAPESWHVENFALPFLEIALIIVALVIANFLADLIAIWLIIYYLARTIDALALDHLRATRRIIWNSLWAMALYYLLFLSVMGITFSLVVYIQGVAAGYFGFGDLDAAWAIQRNIFISDTEWRLLDPISEGKFLGINGVNLLVFCLTPLLAPGLVLIAAFVGAAFDITDTALNGRASSLLRTLAGDRKPFFLKLASTMAIVGAGAATLLGAVK